MAIFYYPNRGAATTVLTIELLESHPSSRSREKLQSRDLTPGGQVINYDLGVAIQYLALVVRNLSLTDKTALVNFIESKANWTSNTFDYTDPLGIPFNSCRFWFDDYDFVAEQLLNRFSEDLLLRLDPP